MAKSRFDNHLKEDSSELLVAKLLPEEWVIRKLHPARQIECFDCAASGGHVSTEAVISIPRLSRSVVGLGSRYGERSLLAITTSSVAAEIRAQDSRRRTAQMTATCS